MHRRDALKLCLTTLGIALSPSLQRAFAQETLLHDAAGSILSEVQHNTLAHLAELIIPTTDTPGAIAAGVPEFIAHLYSHWFTDNERETLRQGLARLEQRAQESQGCQFFQASQDFQIAELAAEEAAALSYVSTAPVKGVATREHDPNAPFFTRLKELVVLGYYTSEIGCKQEQIYSPMHGSYEGELLYSDFNRRFSS